MLEPPSFFDLLRILDEELRRLFRAVLQQESRQSRALRVRTTMDHQEEVLASSPKRASAQCQDEILFLTCKICNDTVTGNQSIKGPGSTPDHLPLAE